MTDNAIKVKDLNIRYALRDDLNATIQLADTMRSEAVFLKQPMIVRYQKRKWLLVAEEDKHIIGFVLFTPDKHRNTRINFIGVHKAHRRRGIGRYLINKLIEDQSAIGGGHICIKSARDFGASGFYESLGFEHRSSEQVKTKKKIKVMDIYYYFLHKDQPELEF